MSLRVPGVVSVAAVVAAIVASAIGGYALAGARAGSAGVATGTDAGLALASRTSLEQLLATKPITPTGRTKTFDLAIGETTWELVPGVTTQAVAVNRTVPGPTIRVTEGDAVVVNVRNQLTEPTSIHWHGVHVPNDQDGVSGVTQDPIPAGGSYTYRFTASHAGTFMYHAHGPKSREQIDRGLYAPLIIDPAGPDQIAADVEQVLAIGNWMVGSDMATMGAMSMDYNYFTINGKSYPATTPIAVRQGQLVRLRIVNPSQTLHPMHLHGLDMAVVAKDGEALPQPQRLNTLDVAPGDTYDVVILASAPGTWLFHCHDLHHVTNNGVEPGGLIVPIVVTASDGPSPSPSASAIPAASSAAPSASPSLSSDPTAPASTTPEHTAVPGMTAMPGM